MTLKTKTIKPVLKSTKPYAKKFLKQSRCLLTISVGQEVHESDKFAATIELVNDNFASCVVLIDDTLQRYSMSLQRKEHPDSFYEKSLKEGDCWLDRNQHYLDKLTIPTELIRWDKWLNHSHYRQQHECLHQLVKSDLTYKMAFEETIRDFLHRFYSRLPDQNLSYLNKDQVLCQEYLLEECTALCLWVELNCQFEVYPSKRNSAMSATHKRFVLSNHPDLLHTLSIKFKNRKQLKAQCFSSLKEEVT